MVGEPQKSQWVRFVNREFIVKWISCGLVMLGGFFTAFNFIPMAKIAFFLSAIGWFWIGIRWRQPSLWAVNLFLIVMYALGYITQCSLGGQ